MSKLFIERVVSMSWLPLMLSFVHTRTLISMLFSAVVRKNNFFLEALRYCCKCRCLSYQTPQVQYSCRCDWLSPSFIPYSLANDLSLSVKLISIHNICLSFLLSQSLFGFFLHYLFFCLCLSFFCLVLPRSLPFDESAIVKRQKPSPRAWSTNSLWSSTLSYESTDKCAKRFSSYSISLLFVYVLVFVSSINRMNQHIN